MVRTKFRLLGAPAALRRPDLPGTGFVSVFFCKIPLAKGGGWSAQTRVSESLLPPPSVVPFPGAVLKQFAVRMTALFAFTHSSLFSWNLDMDGWAA